MTRKDWKYNTKTTLTYRCKMLEDQTVRGNIQSIITFQNNPAEAIAFV